MSVEKKMVSQEKSPETIDILQKLILMQTTQMFYHFL